MNNISKITSQLAVGLLLFVLFVNAALTDDDHDPAIVKTMTNRHVADLLNDMDQAMVVDGERGFTLWLETDAHIAARRKKMVTHNQRYEAYAAKRRLLEKQRQEFSRRIPGAVAIKREYAVVLKRMDADENGRLEVTEIEKPHLDVNKDGIVDMAELGLEMRPDDSFSIDELRQQLAEITQNEEHLQRLAVEFEGTTSPMGTKFYHRIVEITPTFIRLQSKTEERIIPIAAIHEFRRQLNG